MSINPIINELFASYNLAIQEKCERSLGTIKSFSDFEELIDEARIAWENIPLNARIPAEIFAELKTEEDLSEVFETAAEMCDEFIPRSLVVRIIESGFMKFIEKSAFGDSSIDVKKPAIKILGISGNAAYTETLMNIIYIEGEYSDLLKETARQALIDIGSPAVRIIETKLSGKDILTDDDFHLVIALIGIDSKRKTDTVFKILKDSFRKTSDKALAARCLSDYGDGRAVPMLRSYLERNMDNLDENTIFELQGAVLNLGGSTVDLDTPLKS